MVWGVFDVRVQVSFEKRPKFYRAATPRRLRNKTFSLQVIVCACNGKSVHAKHQEITRKYSRCACNGIWTELYYQWRQYSSGAKERQVPAENTKKAREAILCISWRDDTPPAQNEESDPPLRKGHIQRSGLRREISGSIIDWTAKLPIQLEDGPHAWSKRSRATRPGITTHRVARPFFAPQQRAAPKESCWPPEVKRYRYTAPRCLDAAPRPQVGRG